MYSFSRFDRAPMCRNKTYFELNHVYHQQSRYINSVLKSYLWHKSLWKRSNLLLSHVIVDGNNTRSFELAQHSSDWTYDASREWLQTQLASRKTFMEGLRCQQRLSCANDVPRVGQNCCLSKWQSSKRGMPSRFWNHVKYLII